jgi:hypothetical protein
VTVVKAYEWKLHTSEIFHRHVYRKWLRKLASKGTFNPNLRVKSPEQAMLQNFNTALKHFHMKTESHRNHDTHYVTFQCSKRSSQTRYPAYLFIPPSPSFSCTFSIRVQHTSNSGSQNVELKLQTTPARGLTTVVTIRTTLISNTEGPVLWPLWSSGQSSWLQIQRSRFNSLR